MKLPFTHDQFLDVFGAYNRALWPAALLLWGLSVVALVALLRRGASVSRFVAALLAVHWAWAGIAYHLAMFRSINPAATLFGGLFLVEAALLGWRGAAGRLTFAPPSSTWGRIGVAVIAYALLYPGLGLVLGLELPRWPSFGVPCPTTILTVGMLLLSSRREARRLGAIPLVWSAVGGSAAILMNVRADYGLIVAGALLLAFMIAGPAGGRK
jgi:hypothetical protein